MTTVPIFVAGSAVKRNTFVMMGANLVLCMLALTEAISHHSLP